MIALFVLASSASLGISDEQIVRIGSEYLGQVRSGATPTGVNHLDLVDMSQLTGFTPSHRLIELSEVRELLRICEVRSEGVQRFERDGQPVVAYEAKWDCSEGSRKFRATMVLELTNGTIEIGRLVWNERIFTVPAVAPPENSESAS